VLQFLADKHNFFAFCSLLNEKTTHYIFSVAT